MVSFVLDGRLVADLGPRRQVREILAGDALLIGARTPFRYRFEPGTRLLVLDAPALESLGLGLARVPTARLPARLAQALARTDRGREADLRRLSEDAADLAAWAG